MGNLFVKKPKITDVDRAILSLKTQRRKLAQYQQKIYSALLLQLQLQLLTFMSSDCMRRHIELASKQKAVFESLKAGTDTVKAIQSEINLDDVQKLMDDTEEAKAYQDEINAILGEKLSAEDEEEILAEFENLEAQLTVEDLPEVPTPLPSKEHEEKLDLPDVPTKPPVAPHAVGDDAETASAELSTNRKVLEEPLPA
ncbi:Charged multivesicular body protein, putative [Ricinus communis]|uniref:Charged multivesicular body protein, putative n=1 Tax=Ricinus communis TaxID=3988 RepID=B9T5A6_RICCO|nr:Charged multivesicular body protein, putative [Ricinus communis]